MKKKNDWSLEDTWKCFEDVGLDKSYYETYGWEMCSNITHNEFMRTSLKTKLNCLEKNNAYINPI